MKLKKKWKNAKRVRNNRVLAKRYMNYLLSLKGAKGLYVRFMLSIMNPAALLELAMFSAILGFAVVYSLLNTPVEAEASGNPYETAYVQEDTYATNIIGDTEFISVNSRVYYSPTSVNGCVKTADGYYIPLENLSDTKQETVDYDIPAYSGKKSWMGYDVFGSGTNQYDLQLMAQTDQNGLRTVNGRFCVAVGSHFNTAIGQKFDLVLKNGTVIPCIMGDQKADCHTDSANIFTINGCCSEFIVDDSTLNQSAMISGDISSVTDEWNSPVAQIRVYKDNVLSEDTALYADAENN